jgi:hypothetical protein
MSINKKDPLTAPYIGGPPDGKFEHYTRTTTNKRQMIFYGFSRGLGFLSHEPRQGKYVDKKVRYYHIYQSKAPAPAIS